jgi:hypothetical protein
MSDSNDPVEQFIKLLENPRVQALLDKIIEKKVNESFLTSELKPIKRIAELEKITGIYQFEDFEEHEPAIPEKIKELTERLEQPLNKSTESIKLELPIVRPH